MPKVITEKVEDGKFFHHVSEDVAPLLDSLAEQRNHADQNEYKKNPARQRHIGSIPMTILNSWMQEQPPFNAFRPENEKELRRRLQNEYKFLLSVDKL